MKLPTKNKERPLFGELPLVERIKLLAAVWETSSKILDNRGDVRVAEQLKLCADALRDVIDHKDR